MVARFSFRDASEALNNNCVASVLTLAFSISCSVLFGVRSRTTPAIAQAMSARVFRAQPSAHVLAVSTSTLLFAKVPSNTHISRAGLLAVTGISARTRFLQTSHANCRIFWQGACHLETSMSARTRLFAHFPHKMATFGPGSWVLAVF